MEQWPVQASIPRKSESGRRSRPMKWIDFARREAQPIDGPGNVVRSLALDG
jgi:hypothetical protein